MRTALVLFVILLCGCAQVRPTSGRVAALATPSVVPSPHVIGLDWLPGGYSNFVVVTSADLGVPLNQWPTYAVTGQTHLQVAPSQPQQWFALYGTNADGDSGWATK